MKNLFYWNKWQKSHQILYGVFVLLFFFSLCLFIYSVLSGKNTGISWHVSEEIKNTSILLDTFNKGFFRFAVDADNQYIIQSFEGSVHNFPDWCSYLMVSSVLSLLISGCVTASYSKGLWYYLSLTIAGLFFYLLNLDVLEVFGWKNTYWAVIWFLLFGVVTHIFHSFKPLTPIYVRYIIFTLLATLFFFLSVRYSTQAIPLRSFVAYSWLAPFGLSLMYIMIISTDILAGFLFLVTDSKHVRKSSSLLNFLLISLFFLGNILLTFLKNRGSLEWNIFYVEAPLLLIAASLLGIWSFKKKEPVYQMFADFSPATAIWFLVLAINCFMCYSFVNFTGNDPLQEVMEDSVIFTHLTMGIMFIIFVTANFMGMMEQNLPAHLVLYKPRFMPFAFVRIIGLIGVLSIVLYNNNYQYRQSIAGEHIQKAEVFISESNLLLAEEYLNSALSYDAGNFKGNYLLAMLLMQKNKEDILAKGLLKQSMFKNPLPQAYATLGMSFLKEGDIIRSLETLKEGKYIFPQSNEILNNMALAFSKTNITDSAFFYLSAARRAGQTGYVAAANQLAFAIENNIIPDLANEKSVDDLPYNTNLLAVMNKSGKTHHLTVDTSFLADSALNTSKAAYAFNMSLSNIRNPEFFPLRWFDTLIQRPGNYYLYEDLMYAKACKQYYSGNIAEGIITLDQLQATAKGAIKFNNILSDWLIQQDAPKVAMDFLEKARSAGDFNADFSMAIAGSFFMSADQALLYWRAPVFNNDSVYKRIAAALHDSRPNVFSAGILPQLYQSTDYLYDSFNNFSPGKNKTKAVARTMEYLTDKGRTDLAIRIYENNPKSDESSWQYLRALKISNQKDKLISALKNDSGVSTKTLYLAAWLSKDSDPQAAAGKYRAALTVNPLYEEGVTEAIEYLRNKQSSEETYNMLLTSVMLNQYSVKIQKAYALQSVESNYFNFADYSLLKLKNLMSKTDYEDFRKIAEAAKEEKLSKAEWNN